MSYYTRLELQWDDADYTLGTITPEMVSSAAVDFVARNEWGRDVLDDLRASAAGEGLERQGYNRIEAEALVEMLREISRAFSNVTFFARGIGEDMFDTWMRTIRAGEIVSEFGPIEPSA
ncbi:hypothetical protein FB547_110231 [Variovorax beijingensis]|uniref:Uncharacterized protein n=1 Tax=Variovorax beijingensis TaxID=2496117 RepID=A0A561BEH3_9BURK|nr:hypothetical protein [Variovorax beijingensis]TWD77269.1 hypothetical protein FB547_110231 [Variovorax beijingensis]